jgi:hypothetical protein
MDINLVLAVILACIFAVLGIISFQNNLNGIGWIFIIAAGICILCKDFFLLVIAGCSIIVLVYFLAKSYKG